MRPIVAMISGTMLLLVAACADQRNSPDSPRPVNLTGQWQRSELASTLPPVTLTLRQTGDSLLGEAALSGVQLTVKGTVRNGTVHLELLSRAGTVSLVLEARLDGANAMEGTLRSSRDTLAVKLLRTR